MQEAHSYTKQQGVSDFQVNICINSKNELIDSKGINFIIDSQIGVLSESNTLVQLEQASGGMSTIVGHSLGVSKALQDGDREGMNSQPRSHSQCLCKSAYQLCLYVSCVFRVRK